MGAILDPVSYEQTDAKPVLLLRNYTAIPLRPPCRFLCLGVLATCKGTLGTELVFPRKNAVPVHFCLFKRCLTKRRKCGSVIASCS